MIQKLALGGSLALAFTLALEKSLVLMGSRAYAFSIAVV